MTSPGQWLTEALWIALWISMPALVAAVVVSIVVGIVQALFQIQDQSVPYAAKLLCVTLALAICGPWMAGHVEHLLRRADALIAQPAAGTR